MNQKYVITGAPGTGKTTIINELQNRGFNCIHENSREIISQQINKNGNILPWKNQIAFENKIAELRAKQYLSCKKESLYFFDRSALDCIAYLKVNNLKVTLEITNQIKKCNFNKKVFYTPFWKEIFINDNERKEDMIKAEKIENHIIKTYRSKGYQLISIPKISISERADFIISQL